MRNSISFRLNLLCPVKAQNLRSGKLREKLLLPLPMSVQLDKEVSKFVNHVTTSIENVNKVHIHE